MNRSINGFTIVELLIVIVIIAVLAAITTVAYNGIQNRSRSSIVQNDLSNMKKKLLMYKVDNGRFPQNTTQLAAASLSVTKSAYDTTGNNAYYCYNTTNDTFALAARTIGNTAAFNITSDSALQLQGGGVSGDTVCQSIGLTGWNDPNGFIANGHASGGGWQSWLP